MEKNIQIIQNLEEEKKRLTADQEKKLREKNTIFLQIGLNPTFLIEKSTYHP